MKWKHPIDPEPKISIGNVSRLIDCIQVGRKRQFCCRDLFWTLDMQ
jgi:hypothetical protein